MHGLPVIVLGWITGLWAGAWWGRPLGTGATLTGLTACLWLAGTATGAVSRRRPPGRQRPPRPNSNRAEWLAIGTLASWAGLCCSPQREVPAPIPAGVARLIVDVEHSRATDTNTYVNDVRVRWGRRLADGARIAPGSTLRLGAKPLAVGARLRVLATVRPEVRYRNPSPHPPWPGRAPLAGRGQLIGSEALVRPTPWPLSWLVTVRQATHAALQRSLSATAGDLARALILGERGAIRRDLRNAVASVGLSHILAVSGLHVGLMAGFIVTCIRQLWLWLPGSEQRWEAQRVACACGVPLALLLAWFCGASPSALRAGLTAACSWCVRASGRRPSPTASTAAAVLALTVWQPNLALQPAFLLSVLATAAILSQPQASLSQALDPTLNSGTRGTSASPMASLGIAWRTTVATAPITLWCFGGIPVLGLWANLLAIPLVAWLLLPLTLLHCAFLLVLPAAAPLTAVTVNGCAAAFDRLASYGAELAPQWQWPTPTIHQGIANALGAWACIFVQTRLRWLVCLAALILWAGAEYQLRRTERPQDKLRVTFFDVGQGDSALLDLPDGRALLIDAGGDPAGRLDPGRDVLLPILRARRREHLDVVVISHPHPDHFGGLQALLDPISMGEVWDSGQADAEREVTGSAHQGAALLDALRSRGTVVHTAQSLCDRQPHFGKVRVRILSPCPTYDSAFDENNNSLVLLVQFGRAQFLFTGDMEREAEARLLAREPALGPLSVLKVGHHGSRTSTTSALLSALRPHWAVISRGMSNRFGHPHPETMGRLLAQGTRVIDLGLEGGTVVTTDGNTIELQTWSGHSWQRQLAPSP